MRRSAMLAARPLVTARTMSSKSLLSSSVRGMKRRWTPGFVSRSVWTVERQSSLGVSNGPLYMAAGRSQLPLTSILPRRRMFSSELPDHDVVGLPALSPTMEMGTITEWKVKEGDAFAAGDIICMVETDKATVDFEAQDEAVLAKILVASGTPDVPVGTPIMVLTDSTDNVAALKDFTPEGATAAAEPPTSPPPVEVPSAAVAAPEPAVAAIPTPSISPPSTGGRIAARVAASPLAKRLAREQGYELSAIAGTGPDGRIIAADVKEFIPAAALAEVETTSMPASPSHVGHPSPGGEFVDHPLSEQALAIAQNLTVSKQTVPHYYLTVDLKLEKLLKVREDLNEGLPEEEQLSLNDMLIKAAALASEKVPDVNASWMDTFVRQYNTFDVNVVVGVGDGLVAPVVRDVGRKGLKSISDEVKALASSAQAQELEPHQVATGTFTVTNLGVYGVKNFAPIVRMPQACSLAIGAAEEKVIPNEDPDSDEIYQLETMLSATLSCDHRVVDGAVSAQWLAAFRGLVENPLTMLL